VNGTPTFFINGFRHNGGYDLRTLAAALTAGLPVGRA
jgi:protein-disulfide isomerase